MKGDKKVLEHLNEALKNELTSINQYFVHSRMANDWGLTKLGQKEYDESIEEMRHADVLIERILFLEGRPAMQTLANLHIGQTVPDMLKGDLELESLAHSKLKLAIEDCEKADDFVSRNIFREILASEEEHIDWLETQIDLISRIGVERYQQSMMG